jgi:hypothetical protein
MPKPSRWTKARSHSPQDAAMPTALARLRRSLLLAVVVALAAPWQALAADPTPTPDATPSANVVVTTETPAPIETPAPTPDPTPDPTPAPTDAPVLTPDPTPAPTDAPPPPPAPVVRMVDVNLYRLGSAVHQFTNTWCVPANAQKMLNIINATADRRYATQLRYSRQIRKLNAYRYPTPGNDVRGWARFLDAHVGGPWHYTDRSFRTKGAAITAMAEAIDRTGHPVGIVVNSGTHAWTVVGYRATVTEGVPGRTIVGLYVSGSLRRDPFAWRYMALSQFALRYTRYHESTRRVVWEGKFVIVSE